MRKESARGAICAFLGVGFAALGCGGSGTENDAGSGGSGGSSNSGSGVTPMGSGGYSASGGSNQAGSGTGGSAGSSGSTSSGGSSGSVGSVMCSQAASAYTVSATPLDASFVPAQANGFRGDWLSRVPVAVAPTGTDVYVAFTRETGGGSSAVIARSGAPAAEAVEIADATIGGVAVTGNGLAALIFDPSEDPVWAAVTRVGFDGAEQLSTDLFRSPNLEDDGTKGEPSTSRLGYLASSDTLVAYFGHTEMYVQGDSAVRHQGGYLASVDASGEQTVHSEWFGSHNLDQRLLVDGARAALLGLGDAYPKGIFFSYQDAPNTDVAQVLAANGVGDTNGQLGGLVDLGDTLLAPFITDRALPPDFDPGEWPNGDEAKIEQVREAANHGKDLGFFLVDEASSVPEGGIEPVWVESGRTGDASLENLKSAPYGSGGLVLLIWAEVSGDGQGSSSTYYTMVIDAEGAICQPRLALDPSYAPSSGDDIAVRADGAVVWANVQADTIRVVTLTPAP
jgi:hypothetical protein